MSTPLQEVYDSFFSKTDEDFFAKEELVFTYFKTAKSKSYKFCSHSLEYTITDPVGEPYDGNFIDTLDQDEIELISLWMLYEHLRRKEQYLVTQKREIGTRDFNSLPDKKRELDGIQNSMNLVKQDAKDIQQQLNTYKYS